MKLQFLGHSTFLLELSGKKIVIDPFISGNPNSNVIQPEDIKVDYILVSHGHQDHVLDVETIAKNNDALVISNYEIVSWFGKKGVKGHGMNYGGKVALDEINVKYVYATHSSTLPDGSNGGNPGGFVIWDNNQSLYFAGDTALTMDMKIIPEFFPSLDAAILPIGDTFTMGYEEALLASDYVNCNKIIACHFDTFPPIKIDKEIVANAFKIKGKDLTIPEIGQEITIK